MALNLIKQKFPNFLTNISQTKVKNQKIQKRKNKWRRKYESNQSQAFCYWKAK